MKKYAVFLSFAQPDRELAEKLSGLFEDIRETVYFAPETLRRSAGGEEWRKHVLQGI